MRAAVLIAAKDLRSRMRDRSAIIFGLVVPLGLILIFDAVFGSAFTGDLSFSYVVADEDGGELATAFTDSLRAIDAGGTIEVATVPSADAARRAAADGDVSAAFIVPEGFSQAATSGTPTALEVVGNTDATLGTQIAASIAEGFAAEVGATRASVAMVAASGGDVAALAAAAAQRSNPVTVETVGAETRQLDAGTYLAAGMAVFFLFFTVQLGVTSLLEERRVGTLDRLLVAPVGRGAVLAGKALTSFTLGVVSLTVLLLAATFLIGAEWGNPLGVALLVVGGVLSAVGVMAVVASLAERAEQANVWQSIIAVVLGMLGGAFFPLRQSGGVLADLTLLSPHHWFLRGLSDLAGGAGPGAALPAFGVLLLFAGVTVAIALPRLARGRQS